MYLPDTNVWLALVLSGHEFHGVARGWFAAQGGRESVLLCRATQQSFLRLLTVESVMQRYGVPACGNAEAWRIMEGLLADLRIGYGAEPHGVELHWKTFAVRRTASPKLWMDAYLAAFAIAGGHKLITMDQAFAQFSGLDSVILAKSVGS
jgi:toxin-antitoxin system PIN domain toxin